MYSRPSKYRNMSIPENYSGNAFNNSENNLMREEEPPPIKPSVWESARDLPEEQPAENNSDKTDSLLPSLLAGKFPFDHGIGTEELIILGVMLIILRSPEEKPDSDMLLILALLLFGG